MNCKWTYMIILSQSISTQAHSILLVCVKTWQRTQQWCLLEKVSVSISLRQYYVDEAQFECTASSSNWYLGLGKCSEQVHKININSYCLARSINQKVCLIQIPWVNMPAPSGIFHSSLWNLYSEIKTAINAIKHSSYSYVMVIFLLFIFYVSHTIDSYYLFIIHILTLVIYEKNNPNYVWTCLILIEY